LRVRLPGKSSEQLDRIGEQDRRRAEQGLVPLMGEGGTIYYKHIEGYCLGFDSAEPFATAELT
jgi:hypothetical protein